MSKVASIKVGELATLVIPVTVKATGAAYDLTSQTSIIFRFQKRNSSEAAFTKTGTYTGDLTDGIAAYTLLAADWTDAPALSEGTWSVIVEVNKTAAVKRFAPGEGTLTLKIESALS